METIRKPRPKFLTAEWRKLVMVNYEIDPKELQAFVPQKTEIDYWNGKTYVSLVGFMFLNTKVLGIKFPFHVNFEEVNLRFYVRHKYQNEWRRGVVFIKEIVPKWMIANIANWRFNENYVSLPMRHEIVHAKDQLRTVYEWKFAGEWQSLQVQANPTSQPLVAGSQEEFIAEHYWGYAAGHKNQTIEYEVGHPAWEVYQVNQVDVQCDFARLYGEQFKTYMEAPPASAFLAEGSPIFVCKGSKI
ncbi:MAG TPA: hypothetical protein DCS93_07155 [Microscillaceae bacterium]|nr:hypothetical protein [Microscillaceae bacterium]